MKIKKKSKVVKAVVNKKQSPKAYVKKALISIGVISLILVAIGASIIIYLATIANEMDKSSKEYMDNAIPAISSNWDIRALEDRASNEFNDVMSDGDLESFFNLCHEKLGKMKVYLWSNGQSRVFLNNFTLDITAVYISDVEFEKGKASIQTTLIRKGDKWEILGYKVDSQVFKPY